MNEINESELFRLKKMSTFENRLNSSGYKHIAGVDEAGRGPLAGPVVAASCILLDGAIFPFIDDSKRLSKEKREGIYLDITASPFVKFAIGIVDVEIIDKINILKASLLAMEISINNLKSTPEYILVDGNRSPYFKIPSETIVKGDSLSVSIAAASIIAKVTRDKMMEEFDEKWPQYGFKRHKGYGTEEHVLAIQKYGPCPIHRKSFEPIKSILNTEPIQASFFH